VFIGALCYSCKDGEAVDLTEGFWLAEVEGRDKADMPFTLGL